VRLSARDIDDLIDVVRNAAASEIMPRFRNLSVSDVETKSGPADLVTVADRAAEEMIRRGVEKILPGAAVIGEEAVAEDARLLDAICTSETCVIVDPIDGTGNYVAGLAVFGTILAVVHNGQTMFGVLYDPVLDDWMFAQRGDGAWFRRPDGTVTRLGSCDKSSALDQARGYVTLDDYDSSTREIVRRGFDPVMNIRDIRCSCHEYRGLVSGRVDFLRSYALKPWDHAAGVLLVEEVGGWAAVDGEHPYSPSLQHGRLVAATSESLGRRIAKLAAPLP
jgi:fructose-1,6-bisphosphatase/inositol monophosphatase family enzyme